MKKQNEKTNFLKVTIIFIILAVLLVGFYYYISNRSDKKSGDMPEQVTEVQRLILHNLDKNYPPTPKEVVKFYSEITKCFYGSNYTEIELHSLAEQAQKLYDTELIANQGDYLQSLKKDIASMKASKYTISSFSPASSTDVEYFSEDGFEWAKLQCVYSVRKSSKMMKTTEEFLLRKDEDGRWKIYGWKLAEE